MSDFIIRLLQKWAAGKPLPKQQINELQLGGFLTTGDVITLTDKGTRLLNERTTR